MFYSVAFCIPRYNRTCINRAGMARHASYIVILKSFMRNTGESLYAKLSYGTTKLSLLELGIENKNYMDLSPATFHSEYQY